MIALVSAWLLCNCKTGKSCLGAVDIAIGNLSSRLNISSLKLLITLLVLCEQSLCFLPVFDGNLTWRPGFLSQLI